MHFGLQLFVALHLSSHTERLTWTWFSVVHSLFFLQPFQAGSIFQAVSCQYVAQEAELQLSHNRQHLPARCCHVQNLFFSSGCHGTLSTLRENHIYATTSLFLISLLIDQALHPNSNSLRLFWEKVKWKFLKVMLLKLACQKVIGYSFFTAT